MKPFRPHPSPLFIASVVLAAVTMMALFTDNFIGADCAAANRWLSVSRIFELSRPYAPLDWWLAIFPQGSEKLLVLLLTPLLLACIYRASADTFNFRQTILAELIAGVLPVLLAFMGWSVLGTWLSLLVMVTVLLAIRVEWGPRVQLALIIFVALLAWWNLSFVALAVALYVGL